MASVLVSCVEHNGQILGVLEVDDPADDCGAGSYKMELYKKRGAMRSC